MIDRVRLLRLLLALPPGATAAGLAKRVGMQPHTLYQKLRGMRGLAPDEEGRGLEAAGKAGADLCALPETTGQVVVGALSRFRLRLTRDELAAAVGDAMADGLISTGFLSPDDDGRLRPLGRE